MCLRQVLTVALIAACVLCLLNPAHAVTTCPGDTRTGTCDFDSTHRVCAKLGDKDTSFWAFTGQQNWCNTIGNYNTPNGDQPRCPPSLPYWCICKWATAEWIKGEGCNENVEFDCEATDVCDLKNSYHDYDVDLKPAHDCMAKKCPTQWNACSNA